MELPGQYLTEIIVHMVGGAVRVGNDFRKRTHKELYDFINDVGMVQRINIKWLRCHGHVIRMVKNVPTRRVTASGTLTKR